jgi:EAL domain-containing protein (putative c-di-GMP-specific phosphodiesterase class I)
VSRDGDSIGAIGDALVEALGNQRLHSVSLHEPNADILWLSEGVMGPDEHNVVLEASNALNIVGDRSHIFQHIGDGRSALFLPARAPNGELVGLATILSESKWLDVSSAAKLVNAQTLAAMRRLAILRKPAAPAKPAAPLAAVATPAAAPAPVPPVVAATPAAASDPDLLEFLLDDDPPAVAATKPATPEKAPPARPQTLPPGLAAVQAKLAAPRSPAPVMAKASTPAVKPTTPKAPTAKASSASVKPSTASKAGAPHRPSSARPTTDAPRKPTPARDVTPIKPIEFEGAHYELHVQQLLKLRSGGGTRRYEVLARRVGTSDEVAPTSISDTIRKKIGTSQFDKLVVESLVKWLSNNPSIWDAQPASFSINISLGSIADPNFLAFVSSQIKSQGVPANTIGFELDESVCIQHRKDVDVFVVGCEKIGCFVAIDDFTLHSSAVQWLASRAVRFVKIDPRITQSAMSEKLSQAMVVAMSQASKVLGISCVAKRIDTPAARQWLSAVGVDYAQGFLLEQPRTLDSLLTTDGAKN